MRSAWQIAYESGITKSNAHHILKLVNWRCYIPTLMDALNEDIAFPFKIIWSKEIIFQLNGSINPYNCTYWAHQNLHVTVDQHLNLSEIKKCSVISSLNILGQLFLDQTVTGDIYLNMLQESICPYTEELFGCEETYFQHYGTSSHYHCNVRAHFYTIFLNKWIG